jgi:hypothetical protein
MPGSGYPGRRRFPVPIRPPRGGPRSLGDPVSRAGGPSSRPSFLAARAPGNCGRRGPSITPPDRDLHRFQVPPAASGEGPSPSRVPGVHRGGPPFVNHRARFRSRRGPQGIILGGGHHRGHRPVGRGQDRNGPPGRPRLGARKYPRGPHHLSSSRHCRHPPRPGRESRSGPRHGMPKRNTHVHLAHHSKGKLEPRREDIWTPLPRRLRTRRWPHSVRLRSSHAQLPEGSYSTRWRPSGGSHGRSGQIPPAKRCR